MSLVFSNVLPVSQRASETAVIEFAQAVGQLVRRFREAAPSQELSWTEAAVLKRLERCGPATTADLARSERMKPQSMGAVVARLADLGLVERTPHPTDGRQVNLALSAKGAAVRKTTLDAKRTWLAQAIAQLDRRERETLFEAGEIIKRMVE